MSSRQRSIEEKRKRVAEEKARQDIAAAAPTSRDISGLTPDATDGSAGAGVAKPKVKVSTLDKGLRVVRTETKEEMVFEVDNTTRRVLSFTMGLDGSKNLKFADGSATSVTMCVAGRTEVGRISLDPRGGWQLKAGYSWKEAAASALGGILRQSQERMSADVERYRSRTSLLRGEMRTVPLDVVIEDSVASGGSFVDLDFAPLASSLFEPGAPRDKEAVVWRRAHDIFAAAGLGLGRLLDAGVESADIVPAKRLGDRWLLGAIATLLEHEEEVRRLFSHADGSVQMANAPGVYEVRMHKNGGQQCVRLDDYVPCIPGGGPLYGHSCGGELWMLLLEKAMAKVHGSYGALSGGLTWNALMDLSGRPTENVKLKEMGAENVFELMSVHVRLENGVCAVMKGQDTWGCTNDRRMGGPGLVSGHGYPVVGTVTLSTGGRLVLVRNPWEPDTVWDGAWSDGDVRWTASLRAEAAAAVEAAIGRGGDVGLFWMSLDDFMRYFSSVAVCHLHASDGGVWKEQRVRTRLGVGGGRAESDFVRLSVTGESGEAWIGVHQMDERVEYAPSHVDLGAIVMRILPGDTLEYVGASGGDHVREAQVHIDELSLGEYVIVPFSGGLLRARDEKRKRATRDTGRGVKDSTGAVTDEYASMLRELFDRYDTGLGSCQLGVRESCELLGRLEGRAGALAADEGRDLIGRFEKGGRTTGLSYDGLCAYFGSRHAAEVPPALERVGYDAATLELGGQRSLTVSVHSRGNTRAGLCGYDASVYAAAVQQWAAAEGKTKLYDGGKLKCCTLPRGSAGLTMTFESCFQRPARVKVNAEKSNNVRSHVGSLSSEAVLQPGERALFHNFQPIDLRASYSYSWTVSWQQLSVSSNA